MASPYQQQALQRKLIYAVLILALFSAAWGWRHYVVDAQARDLAIREQSRGDVELTGAVVRLGLTGSRGLATCVLWINAMDKQKKNQWNELELIVRSLTKLQPHFITPWLFQSWNLAYNVSVESDRPGDKYFYVTRGVDLLAEGERQNRDHPDLRWSIGFYMQHKIGQSDETNVMRSLEQLSCIHPNERDPARFWVVRDGRQELNLLEFEQFCKDHPQLVRRLSQGIRRETKMDQRRQFKCVRPEEVVQFLADNFRVPSLFKDETPAPLGAWQAKTRQEREDEGGKRPPLERFPVLPPPRPPQTMFDRDTLTYNVTLRDEDDVYQASRAWYAYAQEPIPPPSELPGIPEPITDPVHQRRPRYMTTLIFRNYPAQAQRYTAERLQDEGWYDKSGWEVPDWFRDQGDKFSDGSPAQVGTGREWSLDAWRLAYDLWRTHGEANHLLFKSESERRNMEELSQRFSDEFHVPQGTQLPPLRDENLTPDQREKYFAFRFMKEHNFYNNVSNFQHHYNRALVESKEETVLARKLLFNAEALRLRNKTGQALAMYQDPRALKGWREKVLLKNKEFRRDDFTQEQSYEVQLKYIDLYTELGGSQFKAQAAGLFLVPTQVPTGVGAGVLGACPVALASWVPGVVAVHENKKLVRVDWSNPLLGGPFDGSDEEGVPLVGERTRMSVLQRMYPNLQARPAGGPPPNMPHPTPPQPSTP